ncbi:hypothetical protein PT974_07036 [Cladobotryum mycophilum]|uniref:Uncharacterized protein n=1 Tax=Cladobotryum mycophilum TaxID=491253 RepID=A0ABR0SNW6_9HYPO
MLETIKENAPFIKAQRAETQPYSKFEETEGDEDEAQLLPSQSRHRKRGILSLASSFILGALAVVLVLSVWRFMADTAPNRRLPEMREGTDEKTGLPLSWSHGDCGNSPEDALARNCRYSIVLHSWLPETCLTDEDMEDEQLMHQGRTWPYTLDSGKNLTIEELKRGDYGHFTTSFYWHVTHCMYVWKRLHRIALDGSRRLDSYTANFHHTNHCVKMIGGDPAGMKDSGTKIFVKYPVCA